MKTKTIILAALALAALLGGCIVYDPPDPDGPDFYRPAVHQPARPVAMVRAEFYHSDIEWLVWEYYDWDYDIVYDLHYRYKYTDDEVALILFLAYYGHCEPVRIVQWRQSGIPWMTITTYNLRLKPDIFFVTIAPAAAHKFGPPYGNAYGRYWKNPKRVELTDSEMVNLVYLKTTCQAYNASPVEVIKLREQGRDFSQIVWMNRSQGRHIKTAHGRDVKEPSDRVKMKPLEKYKPADMGNYDDMDKPDDKGKPADIDKPDDRGKPDDKGKPGLKPDESNQPSGDKVKTKPETKPSKIKGKKPKGSGKSTDSDKSGNPDNKGGNSGGGDKPSGNTDNRDKGGNSDKGNSGGKGKN